MSRKIDRPPRAYHAPLREGAAQRTRALITEAAKETFEQRGWQGATVPAIAERAGVSGSTVEAIFRTKPVLLQAAVDYAIRGDIDPLPMRDRAITAQIESAADARAMLALHAAHLRGIHSRSADLAFVVEHAAKSDERVATLWQQMNENRRYGVEWAARTLRDKPGVERLDVDYVEQTFWVALDWGNYRTLTDHAGLSDDDYEHWILAYYLRMFALGQSTRR
jgi:AcrR family transcriptional regulator